MEEVHVRECIKDQFRERNVYAPEEAHIRYEILRIKSLQLISLHIFREVLNFIQWGPKDLNIFSKSGCKRISSKVSVMVAKYYNFPKKEL